MSARFWLLMSCVFFHAISAAQEPPQTSRNLGIPTLTPIQIPKEQPKREVASALPKSEQDKIAKSVVPVLLLPNIRDFVEPRLVVQDMYYTASFNDGKQSISIQGSRLSYEYPGLRSSPNTDKRRIRSTEGLITVSEAIWTASWKEFGAAYVLSVECAEARDRRCESGEYVTRVANSLLYVGGGKVAAGNRPPMVLDQPPSMENFSYKPPGQLLPGSGTGRQDTNIYAPGIRFPIENKPAYANSQVWNPGGDHGPSGGSQCDPLNYAYPWWDNFCETRARDTPMCPAGKGHQGQDIRPASCEKDKHVTVSVTDGTITNIGSYSVFITAPDGTQYRYLHMSNVAVSVGNPVKKADPIGRVSNVFTAPTTIHLHFEVVQNVGGIGFVQVPPYMSLVRAYERLP